MITKLISGMCLAALAAGCASGPAPEDAPRPPGMNEPGNHAKCDTSAVQSYIGQNYSDALRQVLTSQSDSENARVLEPGQPFTLDYRQERLNIYLDEDGRISDLRCG
ncbi:I78 family peptidase inhibitor [Halomonas sp. PR-M31]|uniref:I78 family peptidase inhibitor n=1 Tax=Halomonas sp. PR-M31 TaxID=1471202 RepID=UPI0006524C9B|nr:I78 family peptidase inhibitor [Halomonas sp. PR-M31]